MRLHWRYRPSSDSEPHYRSGVAQIQEILDLNLLIKQLALALGLAMVLGNGYAIIQHRRGRSPKGEAGEFRTARAWWLLGVGVVITVWGTASLVS